MPRGRRPEYHRQRPQAFTLRASQGAWKLPIDRRRTLVLGPSPGGQIPPSPLNACSNPGPKFPKFTPRSNSPSFTPRATRSRASEESLCAASPLPAPLAKGAEPGTSGREGSSKERGGPHTCAQRAQQRREGAGRRGGLPSPRSLRRRGGLIHSANQK